MCKEGVGINVFNFPCEIVFLHIISPPSFNNDKYYMVHHVTIKSWLFLQKAVLSLSSPDWSDWLTLFITKLWKVCTIVLIFLVKSYQGACLYFEFIYSKTSWPIPCDWELWTVQEYVLHSVTSWCRTYLLRGKLKAGHCTKVDGKNSLWRQKSLIWIDCHK